MTAAATRPAAAPIDDRLPELSYFFPAHNEEANLEPLVEEALGGAAGARRPVRDRHRGRRLDGRTAEIADELAAAHPDVVRAVHHPTNLGYGAALRSGFRAARFGFVAFTDGDRQFRVADLGRLTDRMAGPDGRTSSSATGSSGRTRSCGRSTRAPIASPTGSSSACGSATSTAPASCSGARRSRASRVESGGAFFSAELLIKLRAAGRTVVEVGVPHYPRTAGSPTGAKPQVVFRAVRDFWRLRLRMWVEPRARPAARRADPGRRAG